jgi:hypothetical protein
MTDQWTVVNYNRSRNLYVEISVMTKIDGRWLEMVEETSKESAILRTVSENRLLLNKHGGSSTPVYHFHALDTTAPLRNISKKSSFSTAARTE